MMIKRWKLTTATRIRSGFCQMMTMASFLVFWVNPSLACNQHSAAEYTVLNMRILQVMVETYANYHGKSYPSDMTLLLTDAQKHHYYRPLANPYTHQYLEEKVAFKLGKPSGKQWQGVVGYVPVIQVGKIKGYRIYGGDQNGFPIRTAEHILVFKNH